MRHFTSRFLKKLSPQEFRITFSTALTIIRIMLTPFIVYSMLGERWGFAFILFVIAAFTDLLDGMSARWFNQKTFLGTCLDPIADKFLLVSCFATLFCTNALPFSIPRLFLLLVLWRETFLIGGGIAIYYFRGSINVRPSIIGKATTFVQVLFITWLFGCYFFEWFPAKTYYAFLIIMTTLIIASFYQYAHMGLHQWHNTSK